MLCLRTRSAAHSLLMAVVLFFAASPAFAQHTEVQQLAATLAEDIARAGKKTVVVADFVGPEGGFTELGKALALELTSSLLWAGKDFSAARTPLLQAVLKEIGLSPAEQNDPRVPARLAERTRAEVVVLGWIEVEAVRVKLRVRAVAADGTVLREVEGFLPRGPVVDGLLSKRLYEVRPGSPMGRESCASFGPGVLTPGRDGVSQPKCASCPNPGYTEKARREKVSGYVVLRLVITEKGTTEQVSLTQRLGYGLDEAAVEAVRKWRFEPAANRDGKPVATCINAEITFRVQ